MAAQMYYEADCDPSIIRGRKVAIIDFLAPRVTPAHST